VEALSRVVFIRHAETAMAGTYCGHSDPDLNERGRAQISQLVQDLSAESFTTVYSSDLRRARYTAGAIAGDRAIQQILRPALREIHFGEWEGLTWEQIEQKDPQYAQEWMTGYPHVPAPGGETYAGFQARVLAELNQLVGERRGSVAVVTHAGVLRIVLRHLLGCSEEDAWQQTRPYCCVVRYEAKGEII
jgi:alpha-ribazole phosphatase